MCYIPDKAEELQRCVEEAFADSSYPGDDNIATNPECCDECRDTDDFFRGRHWRELADSGEKLQFGWGGLSFLTPEAWRFYIPAYLLVSLRAGEYAEEAAWSALSALSPSRDGSLVDYFNERASGFTRTQQKCLAAYCAAFYELEPDDETYQAAAAFWKDRATGAEAQYSFRAAAARR